MKLRLETNSIRLRVRKSDLEALQTNGSIVENLTFPNNRTFSYQLTIDKQVEDVDAQFLDDTFVVKLPLGTVTTWVHSENVGIEKTLPNGLFILIEKDFPCKDRPWEDTTDTFFELVDKENVQC